MPEATPARPAVLLLAGDVRDAWSAALAAAGFEVRTTGWLDGITAARLQRPDLVLVSADLPANASQMVCTAIRSAPELKEVPIAVVGLAPEIAERDAELPLHADRYIPAPADAGALVREVREALRIGRVPWRLRPADVAVILLLLLAATAVIGANVADEISRWRGGTGLAAWTALLLLGGVALVAGIVVAIGFQRRRRPFTPIGRRAGFGWVGFLLLQSQTLVRTERHAVWKLAAMSLGLLAWAAWASLGPRVKPRTPAATRWFQLLAALLALLAAAPWLAVAWMFAS